MKVISLSRFATANPVGSARTGIVPEAKSAMKAARPFFSATVTSMKAIICSQWCEPQDLVLGDLPDPVAGPGEVVIAIKAAALNFFDILMVQGKYQTKPPFPFSPAAEISGVIESIGSGVTDLEAAIA